MSDAGRVTVRTKTAFAIGSTADSLLNHGIAAYALLYYNQVLGLPAHLAGLAVSAGLVIDGLSDPVAGSMSDRTRSRLGRRHPYLFLSPLPAALAFLAVFNPPAGLGHAALFAWFAVSVSLLRFSLTFYNTPHTALGGELSEDYVERSRVMSFHTLFAWAGTAISSWAALTWFFHATPAYPKGLLNPEAYRPYSLAAAGFAFAALMASAWFTRDRIPHLPRPPPDLPRFSPLEFARDIGRVLRNANYVWLLLALLFVAVMQGVRATLGIYTQTYFWGLTSEQIRWFVIGSFIAYLGGFLFAASLHRRFDKIRVLIVSAAAYAIGPAIPIALGLAGVLRADTPGLLPILISFSVVGYAGASVIFITGLSVLADIADENELRFGVRQEGILYSTRTLFQKIDQAIGAALGGAVLTWIHFPEHATASSVAPDVAARLALWDGVLAAIPGLVALAFYARCRVDRASWETTRAALSVRR